LYGFDGINIHAPFRRACRNGHLFVAQWLYDLGYVNIHILNGKVFRDVCCQGHLSLAQWLYGLNGFDINAENEYAFRMACCNDHLLVAQWLYELDGTSGHLSIAQWLYGIDWVSTLVLQVCLNTSNITRIESYRLFQ
jgi:hypothetical protein